jgi:hypothetical protein
MSYALIVSSLHHIACNVIGHYIRCRMLTSYVFCTTSYAISHTMSHTMFHLIQIVWAKLPARSLCSKPVFSLPCTTRFRQGTPLLLPMPPHHRRQWRQRRDLQPRHLARFGRFDSCTVISFFFTVTWYVFLNLLYHILYVFLVTYVIFCT